MIDYSRYYRAYAEMKDTLDGDYAREYLISAMADADNGNDDLSGNAYNRVIDMEWVEMIEGKLPYIEKAIEEQRKFIEEYKEVDRIDKVKQVGKDAVQHLTQHANLIMAIEEDGSVVPERLLNTHREDSFATYENRFLHTLIYKTIAFVEARFRALQDAPNDSASKLHMDREMTLNSQKFGFNIDYHAESHERDKVDRDEDLSSLTDYERIERIRMRLDDFTNTDLIKSLNNCIAVKSPINKTNCIKQDPAFKQCYDLWVFVEGYRKTGYVLEKNVFEGVMPEEIQKDMYDVMAFQHFVTTINTNRALKEKLHAEYEAENERRAAEAQRPEEEMERYIEDRIYEARREEMALRLKEVREREVIIAKLTAELEQAKEQIRIRDIKIKELESTIAALKKELAETREELRKAQVRIMDLEKEVEQLKAKIAELEAKIAELEAKIADLEAQIERHLATIASLEATVAQLNETIDALNAEIENLRATIAQQAETIKQHEATIADQSRQITGLTGQVSSLTNTVDSLNTENTGLKNTISDQEQTIKSQAEDITAKNITIEHHTGTIASLDSRLTQLQNDHTSLQTRYTELQTDINDLQSSLTQGNDENRELQHQIRVHLNTISAKDAIITTLNEEKSALTDRINGVGVESAESKLKAQIDSTKADYEAKIDSIKADYEAKIAQLEQEKLDACGFTDDEKYAVRLNAEKASIQKDYDAKLAEATKKARKFVKKARVLVDDMPQALLNLKEAEDYK